MPLPPLGDFADVPATLAAHIHTGSGPVIPWAQLDELTQKQKESRVKKWLNTLGVDNMTPALLSAIDPRDDIRTWLNQLAQHLA